MTHTQLKAIAHDAQVRHERFVQRCRDEAKRDGITTLRMKRTDALHARMMAESKLARCCGGVGNG